jgi:hypothetical protein
MFSIRFRRLALSLSTLLCTSVFAQREPLFTSPLPTGVRLDPAGEAIDLGSLPINLILSPEKDRAVVVLSGWREQDHHADSAPGWCLLRRCLLARRPSPLRLGR